MKKQRDDLPATDQSEIAALRERLRGGDLRQEDLQLLDRLLGTLLNLISLLQEKNASLSRLKRILFGRDPAVKGRDRKQRSHFVDAALRASISGRLVEGVSGGSLMMG